MDLRKPVGQGSPLRRSLHDQALNQDRARLMDRTRSPYDHVSGEPRDPRMAATRDSLGDSRYMMRSTAGAAGLGDPLIKVDERHEELRRQIALKEKLLANMQSERESTRRLRYNNDPHSVSKGSLGSINRDRSAGPLPGAPPRPGPVPGPAFREPLSANYPLRSSPQKEGHFPGRLTGTMPSTMHARTGVSLDGTNRDPMRQTQSILTSPDPKQLQFYPPHRSNFAQTYEKQKSPLRNRSKSGGVSGGGSGSRSKSRELSNARRFRPSQERPALVSSQRIPMRAPIGAPDAYQQPPIHHRVETRGSPLRHQSPPSPYRDIAAHRPSASEVTLAPVPVPVVAAPSRPLLMGDMLTAGPQVRERLYVDRIEAMIMDNASLQRRLNGVSDDLTALKHEKGDLISKLKMVETDNDRLNRITNQKDEVDMDNQTMQNDLERTRTENRDLDVRVRDGQHAATNIGGQLNMTNLDKDHLVFESHNVEAELMKCLNRLDELRRIFDDCLQDITRSQIEIENLNAEDLALNHANIDLASAVARVQADRQDLNKKVQELTMIFDDTVRDKTIDRHVIDDRRKWHTKILTCKLLNQLISKHQKQQVQQSFRELREYSDFDQNCHNKLKAFSMICYKLGSYRQKVALHHWYVSTLKPLAYRYQNIDLKYMIDCNRIQARVFYAWRQYMHDKMNRYQHKSSAIDKTWFILCNGIKQEKKRAFCVWKEKTEFQIQRQKTMKHLVLQKLDKNRRQALQRWKSYSTELEYAVRVHVLKEEAVNKVLMSQVFSQLRIQCKLEKQIRLRTLAHCVKGWKDHIRFNRHLMHANMASIQFVISNNKYTLKACFAELVRHKEQKKYKLLNHAVQNDMNPGIRDLEDHNFAKSEVILNRSQYRAGIIVRNMMGKRLFAYFNKWSNYSKHHRVVMDNIRKHGLCRNDQKAQSRYFYIWKSNSFNKKNQKDKSSNMEQLSENEQMQREAMENEKDLRFQEEFIRTTKRRLMDKTIRKLYNRQLGVAMQKWTGICKLRNAQENQYQRATQRMRKRFLRDAFNRYLAFNKWSRQHDTNIKGSITMKDKLDMKTKAKIFNALVFNTNRHQRAKRYWKKILSRMDQYMKLRTLNIWKENANLTSEEMLTDAQHQTNDEIMKRKQKLTEYEKQVQEQENKFGKTSVMRRNKAYKQLGNYFMRSYSCKTDRAMKLWRQHIRDQKHKKEIMLRTIQHWRKSQFAVVKRALRTFVSMDRQNDSINDIKRKQIEQNALAQGSTNGQEQQAALKEETENQMRELMDEANYRNITQKKVMLMMERRNREWHMVSRKRMIFMCWRHASRQQRAFVASVANALDRSLKMKGFHYIKNSYQDLKYHDTVTRRLKKFVNRYMKVNGLDAFNKWKLYALSQVDEKFQNTMMQLKEKDEAFLDHVDEIKGQNNARCFNHFMTKNKANVFRAWANILKHNKLVENKQMEFIERQRKLQGKLAIWLWRQRVEATKNRRTRLDILIRKLNKHLLRASMRGLKDQLKSVKGLTYSMSNFEKMMRTKMLQDAFKTITKFAEDRDESHGIDKDVGTLDIMRMIRQAYFKRMANAFFRFRNGTESDNQGGNQLKALLTKISSHYTRQCFFKWKEAHQRAELLDDQYYAGPVRAECWEAQREIENLQQFMRDEHYSENAIQEYMARVEWSTTGLMNKYLIRWRLRQTQAKWLPSIIDRWKQYVKIRKMIRYQFRFCQNQVHNVKSDLQRAFNKWRAGPEMLGNELSKLPLETLIDLGVRSTNQVAKCSEQLHENQSISNHLMIQRDEFLNYYIKSQVLAMALVKDKTRFAQMQSWSRWNGVRRKENRKDYLREIRDAAYLQANLEAREKELEEKNEELIEENGTISEFRSDGQIVRNNMNKIRDEVNLLKSQIAETDPDYMMLLEEQERLKRELEIAEQKAKTSKNQKFINTASMKGGGNQENQEPQINAETESQKALKERFKKLEANAKGASIR